MKRLSCVVLAVMFAAALLSPVGDAFVGARSSHGDLSTWGSDSAIYVPGHWRLDPRRPDPIYIPPHYRTPPDGNQLDNFNFPGNYNPNQDRFTPGDPYRYLERYYSPR